MNPVRRIASGLAALVMVGLFASSGSTPAQAAAYFPITGSGSTWSQNALDQWRSNVARNYAMTINYNGVGSTSGRRDFIQGTVDFAISEIPFQSNPQDGSAAENPTTGYAYMPIVAGGTSFMYNLKISGQRVTNLRLSGETIAKIFTGKITNWNDAAIKADNPAWRCRARPSCRSSGRRLRHSAQFTLWMSKQFPSIWTTGMTSQFPSFATPRRRRAPTGPAATCRRTTARAPSRTSSTRTRRSRLPGCEGADKAGTTSSRPHCRSRGDDEGADQQRHGLEGLPHADPRRRVQQHRPRTYPLSSYSYAIVPTQVAGIFNTDKGNTLSAFMRYVLCEGQQQADTLGYSPLPMNLVLAGSDQIKRIPGSGGAGIDTSKCNNPTFKAGDSPSNNLLATSAPQPQACDKQGTTQCTTGTGGATASTPVTGSGGNAASGSKASTAAAGAAASGSTATGAPRSQVPGPTGQLPTGQLPTARVPTAPPRPGRSADLAPRRRRTPD